MNKFSIFVKVKQYFDIEIDKLTNSIENRVTGDVFNTEAIRLLSKDKRQIKKSDWLFNWHKELATENREVYKLVITDNENIIQGLICLTRMSDHIFMHLIESASFNRGHEKVYWGVPANLVAFVCKTSFDMGYDGYVAFEAKTKLIGHYQETLGATHIGGVRMIIEPPAALNLINRYYNNSKK